jgi:micrococcal nuclease
MRRTRLLVVLVVVAVAAAGSLLLGRSADRGERLDARVEHVTDGDTVWLTGIGKVRLIGIDTPEVYGQVECYGPQASAFAKRLLPPGRRVTYVLGPEERDRYGRALAYVWLDDGRFLNRLLVERGYATPLTIPPNDAYAAQFAADAREARRAGRGLWGVPGCAA